MSARCPLGTLLNDNNYTFISNINYIIMKNREVNRELLKWNNNVKMDSVEAYHHLTT